jgi:hypothetical protein
MLPRVGQEVLVGFFESDPDRPIIVGRYFTSLQQTPYRLPANKTQSGIKTNSTGGGGGYNELMFEDRGGQELLNMRAQRDMNLNVLNNRASSIGANESRHVARCRVKTVGETDSLTAGQDIQLQAGNDYRCIAQKNLRLMAAEQDLTAAALQNVMINGGTSIDAYSGGVIKLGVGPSSITLTNHGIVIDGPQVLINPGVAEREAFLEDGTTPDQMDERRAAQEQQRLAEAQARWNAMSSDEQLVALSGGRTTVEQLRAGRAVFEQRRQQQLEALGFRPAQAPPGTFGGPILPGINSPMTGGGPLQPSSPFLLTPRQPPPGGPR